MDLFPENCSIGLDNTTNLVYNTDMTNDNNNTKNQFLKGTPDMTNMTHGFRVYKYAASGQYEAFANFTSLKEAVGYMRRWNPNQMTNWYIIDENDPKRKRFQMNQQNKLVVTYSGLGVLATK